MPERVSPALAAGKWPVLARLPDVSALASPSVDSPKSRMPGGAVDYRFDPPQPHPFHRTSHSDASLRTSRHEPPILPSTDPFAIPAARLTDALTPVARFVVLVALFTLAGMFMITRGRERPEGTSNVPAGSTVNRQTLQPTATGINRHVPVAPSATAQAIAIPDLAPAATGRAHSNAHGFNDSSAGTTAELVPQSVAPTTPLPRSQNEVFPRVQVTDPPPAVAHLPGYITAPAPRQASHDDNQSSIH